MMASFSRPLAFSVRSIGPVARRCLGEQAQGRIEAVFGSAFYVASGGHLVCIGTAGLEPGPINLITSVPPQVDWRDCGVRQGESALLSATEIRAGTRLRLRLAGAVPWLPEPVGETIDPALAAQGLSEFRVGFSSQAVEDGISRFLDPDYLPAPSDHESLSAAASIDAARRWLADRFEPTGAARVETGWAVRLVGLGSGLTPAGDDYLGGMMIGLHALGRAEISASLWRETSPVARKSTNAISLALLNAASEGLGSRSLHVAIAAILRGNGAGIRAAIPLIARIGHSSGWDAMAGAVVALDSWLQSQMPSVA
jgi:hypothetical protein